jgi:phage tail-like protein
MPVLRDDPYGAFNYLVTLGGADPGLPIAGFAEVTGLALEIEFVEYRNGNEKPNTVRKLPGLHKVGDVTLKRGVLGSDDLFAWIRDVANGAIDRRDVAITLLDEQRNPAMTWLLRRALPRKWVGPTLKAKGTDVAMEELTITAEGIELE